MNRDKLIPILLFLLLLLIILCTWCHTDKVVKNQAKPLNSTIQSSLNALNSKPINFNLSKNKNLFELKGNFSTQQEVEKIHAALGINDLKSSTNIDNNLSQRSEVISLVQTLIPTFYDKYDNGSIRYENGKIIVEGTVTKQSDKDSISTLLANSKIPSINYTIVENPQPTSEELQAIKAQEEALKALKVKEAETLRIFKEEIEKEKLKVLAEQQEAEANRILQEKNEEARLKALKIKEAETLRMLKEQVEKEKLKVLAEKKAEKIEAKIKKIIDFEDINFELNKATLTEKSINTISQIANVLNENPNVHIEIAGHTDSLGDETHNFNLSQARVDSVKEKLIGMQIAENRIKAVGYGKSKPLVSNDTEENRRINRRVEFKILGE